MSPENFTAWIAPDGTTAFFNQFVPITEAVQFRADRIHVADSRAAFTWTMDATGKTGRHATAEGVEIAYFDENGKIQSLDAYWDPMPFIAILLAAYAVNRSSISCRCNPLA